MACVTSRATTRSSIGDTASPPLCSPAVAAAAVAAMRTKTTRRTTTRPGVRACLHGWVEEEEEEEAGPSCPSLFRPLQEACSLGRLCRRGRPEWRVSPPLVTEAGETVAAAGEVAGAEGLAIRGPPRAVAQQQAGVVVEAATAAAVADVGVAVAVVAGAGGAVLKRRTGCGSRPRAASTITPRPGRSRSSARPGRSRPWWQRGRRHRCGAGGGGGGQGIDVQDCGFRLTLPLGLPSGAIMKYFQGYSPPAHAYR